MFDEKIKAGLIASKIIKALLIYGLIVAVLILVFVNFPGFDKNDRAIIFMGTFALWFCWIIVCGSLMYKYRDKIKSFANMSRKNWFFKFILFSILLLLLEEVFTVSATNLYWLFGADYGKAFITASDNYFETVLLHSAIVLWPAFIFWALWLKKYDFHPNWVMLLYGLSGLFSEMSYGGINQILGISMWVFTYGLMIYLPAYSIPSNRGAINPKIQHYFLSVILPIFFQLPMVVLVMAFRTITGHTFPFA